MSAQPLWTVAEMAAAMGAERQGELPQSVPGLSIDSRSIGRGEAFFAITDRRDGHEFVAAALAAKAGLAVVAAERRAAMPAVAPLSGRARCACGLARARRRARARTNAKVIGVTGSVGKTSTKEALRLALVAGRRNACVGRLLQQPLGRAAVARALSGERALCGSGNGDESPRRDRAIVATCAPACRDHHDHRAGASGISSARSPRSPTPRPRSSSDLNRTAPPSSIVTLRNSAG